MFQFWKRSRSDKNKCVNNFVRWFHGFLWCCVLKIDRKTVGKNHPKTKWKLQVRCKSSAELAYRLLLFRMLLLSTISSKFERKFYLTQCQYCCVEKAVKFNDKVKIFWEGHKILRNLHLTFDCTVVKNKVKISKIFWPSQSIWTLTWGTKGTFWKSFTCKKTFD